MWFYAIQGQMLGLHSPLYLVGEWKGKAKQGVKKHCQKGI